MRYKDILLCECTTCVVQGRRKCGTSVKEGQWVVGVTVTEVIGTIGYRSPVTGLEAGSLCDPVTHLEEPQNEPITVVMHTSGLPVTVVVTVTVVMHTSGLPVTVVVTVTVVVQQLVAT